jgi:hypothetical protein
MGRGFVLRLLAALHQPTSHPDEGKRRALTCKHWRDGRPAWEPVKRLYGYTVWRCTVCGATRTR